MKFGEAITFLVIVLLCAIKYSPEVDLSNLTAVLSNTFTTAVMASEDSVAGEYSVNGRTESVSFTTNNAYVPLDKGVPTNAIRPGKPLLYSNYDYTDMSRDKNGNLINCAHPCDQTGSGIKLIPEYFEYTAACLREWRDKGYVVVIPSLNIVARCNDTGGWIVDCDTASGSAKKRCNEHGGTGIWFDHMTQNPKAGYGTRIDDYYLVPAPVAPYMYLEWWKARKTGSLGVHDGGARDLSIGLGAPLLMPCDGMVDRVGWDGHLGPFSYIKGANGQNTSTPKPKATNGNSVLEITCDNGVWVEALHLKFRQGLAPGRYKTGDLLGFEDTYGNSTGPHLHIRALQGGENGTVIDYFEHVPEKYRFN